MSEQFGPIDSDVMSIDGDASMSSGSDANMTDPSPRVPPSSSPRGVTQAWAEDKPDTRFAPLGQPCPDIMYRILSFVDAPTYHGVVCSCKENQKTATDVRNSVWCLYSLHLDFARVSGPFPHGMSRSLLDWSEINWVQLFRINTEETGKSRVWVRVGNFDLLIPVTGPAITPCPVFIERIQSLVLTKNMRAPRLRHITVNGMPGALASAVFPGSVLMAEWPTAKGWILPSGPIMVTAPMAMLSNKEELRQWKDVKAYENAAKALLNRRDDGAHLFAWHELAEKPQFRSLDFYLVNVIDNSRGYHVMVAKEEVFGTFVDKMVEKVPELLNYEPSLEPCPSSISDLRATRLADALLWTQCETLEMEIDRRSKRVHFRRISNGPESQINQNNVHRRGRSLSREGDQCWSLRSWSPTHRKKATKSTSLNWEGIPMSPDRSPSVSPLLSPQANPSSSLGGSLTNSILPHGMGGMPSSLNQLMCANPFDAAASNQELIPGLGASGLLTSTASSSNSLDHFNGLHYTHNTPDGEYDLVSGKQHSKVVLKSTLGARQFEFHPTIPDLMLIGQKDGTAAIVNTETDTLLTRKKIDQTPILALSWFRSHPQMAVGGAIHSGNLFFMRYEDGDHERERNLKQMQLQPFGFWMGGAELSSLSVNCTDDYVAVSGFSKDIALYDVYTGSCVNVVRNVHSDWVNIVRFANQSPNILASASFDQSLKLYDLRCGLDGDRPIRTYQNSSMNVMCNFSPDDRHILLSGVDANVTRLTVPDFQACETIDIPAAGSRTNYRRSVFLSKDMFVTAATDESFARVVHVNGQEYGCIDFQGSLRPDNIGAMQRIPFVSNIMRHVPILTPIQASLTNRRVPFRQNNSPRFMGNAPGMNEYVQSLRGHPDDASLMGALVVQSSQQMKSCVSLVRLDGIERRLVPAHSTGWSHTDGWVGP